MSKVCKKCGYAYQVYNPNDGFGMKFNEQGICQHCEKRREKSLVSLKKFLKKKKEVV